jgi:hypothetical protein
VSFLDNLENSLKSLDTQDERAADRGSQKEKRDAERAQALAIAPWAEQLKPSPGLASIYTRNKSVNTNAGFGVEVRSQAN